MTTNDSETQFFSRNGVIGTAVTASGIRQYTVLDTRSQACMSTTVANLALRVAREWADAPHPTDRSWDDLNRAVLNIDLEGESSAENENTGSGLERRQGAVCGDAAPGSPVDRVGDAAPPADADPRGTSGA